MEFNSDTKTPQRCRSSPSNKGRLKARSKQTSQGKSAQNLAALVQSRDPETLLSAFPAAGAACARQTPNCRCVTAPCAFPKAPGAMSAQPDPSCCPAGKPDWHFSLKWSGQNGLPCWRRAGGASTGLLIRSGRYPEGDSKMPHTVQPSK